MKTAMTCLSIAGASLCALNASAQLPPGQINEQSLQLVPSNEIPAVGTFWIDGPQGMLPPLPVLPPDLVGEPTYALDDGGFLVDARNLQTLDLALPVVPGSRSLARSSFGANADFSPPLPGGGGSPGPFNPPRPTPAVIFSNAWYAQIVISNHTYVSVDSAFLNPDGTARATQLPPGVIFAVTSTNVALPLSLWQPLGPTNPVAPENFELPYSSSTPAAFFAFELQPDTNIDLTTIPPFTLVATNMQVLTDYGVTVSWANGQPGNAPEQDAIIIEDANGHSYLVGSVVTTGPSNSYSFELTTTNGISYLREPTPATNGTYLYLMTNNFQSPDLMTIPYDIVEDPSSAPIMEVSLYDMTDPSNPQLLAEIDGDGCTNGTLEIPGTVLSAGVRTLEFQVTDVNYSTTVTDFTITNESPVSVIFPVVAIEDAGGNRVLAAAAGSGIAIQATTTATNGSWFITEYDGPSGVQLQQVQVPVASTGPTLMYNDGGEPPGGYTNQWFEFTVTVGSSPPAPSTPLPPPDFSSPVFAAQAKVPPSIPLTNRFRYWTSHPRQPAGEITCYDHFALPSASFDRNYALTAMQTVATMASFTCFPVDFPGGVYTVNNNTGSGPPITSLYEESPWGWGAMNASLSMNGYYIYPGGVETTETPTLPINIFFINGHAGITGADIGESVDGQGTQGGAPGDQLSKQKLRANGFDKKKNGLALAIFASCRVGAGPLPYFVLRNGGVSGQISSSTRTQNNIRWCWALGWNQDKVQDYQLYDFIAWWAYDAAQLNAANGFANTFDSALTMAQGQTVGTGGAGAVWIGCAGMTLDETVP